MKHLTMADKSLLLGDEAADVLIAYAALIAQTGKGDHVTLRAIGADGDPVEASFLLNSGTVMIIETSTSTLPEPDNAAAVLDLRHRLDAYVYNGGGPSPFNDFHNDDHGTDRAQ